MMPPLMPGSKSGVPSNMMKRLRLMGKPVPPAICLSNTPRVDVSDMLMYIVLAPAVGNPAKRDVQQGRLTAIERSRICCARNAGQPYSSASPFFSAEMRLFQSLLEIYTL